MPRDQTKRKDRRSIAVQATKDDRRVVIEAMDALVDDRLAHWSTSVSGLRRLCLESGEVYDLDVAGIRRIR